MDNSVPSLSNSSSSQVFQSDGTIGVPEPPTPAAPVHPAIPTSVSTGGDSSEPVKRRPGRPKGSKKNLLGATPPPPKIKRPVGRPRKDGFPAGSVGPSRPKSKREPSIWVSPPGLSGVGYPPMAMFIPGAPIPPPMTFQIDPNLEKDDWAELAREKPNAFLGVLLNALAAPNPVSSVGPTVEEAFKSHLGSLTPHPQQTQPIPSLYSILKTFWLPSSPAYFSLTASASTARTPSEHRFLYWDPQPLVFNGISCPACSQPLINKGRISSGPIKIYDIEKPFFIIGCEYVCKSSQCTTAVGPEGRKFASTDASILRSLPTKLQDEFPVRLMYGDTDAGSGANIWNWKALGVSRSLWNMVRASLRSGLRKGVILHLIYSIQHGVPEDGGPASVGSIPGGVGENEIEEEEEEGQNIGDEMQQDHDEHPSGEARANRSFGDAYNNAWKENAAVIEPNASKTPIQPSTSALTGTPAPEPHSTSAPPGHSYPPPPQYPPYPPGPYAPYAFFPTALVNAGALHPPNNSVAPSGNGQFSAEAGEPDTPAHNNKRSPRHCCKCGSQECKGKGGRTFCLNPCQDCGKHDCKGRNSRRPDKKCSEGWV